MALADARGRRGDLTGVRPLWGTANPFGNPRVGHGASTSRSADVFAYAGARVKKALEVTREFGENYVSRGGREGYHTLYTTDLRREFDHLARFLSPAVGYEKKIGFTGTSLIEPKLKEPTTHQYDNDCAACMAFPRTYGLEKEFKFGVETNHATPAMRSMFHELTYAGSYGMPGSIDANRGGELINHKTDRFPTDLGTTLRIMLVVPDQGGIDTGGLNFDTRVRRETSGKWPRWLFQPPGRVGPF